MQQDLSSIIMPCSCDLHVYLHVREFLWTEVYALDWTLKVCIIKITLYVCESIPSQTWCLMISSMSNGIAS